MNAPIPHEAKRARLITQARRRLLRHLLDHGTGTIDDARRGFDMGDADPIAMGAVPGPLARAGIIRNIGYRKSTRPLAHSRPVSVWKLVNRGAALAMLTNLPELPPPCSINAPGALRGKSGVDDAQSSGGHRDAKA